MRQNANEIKKREYRLNYLAFNQKLYFIIFPRDMIKHREASIHLRSLGSYILVARKMSTKLYNAKNGQISHCHRFKTTTLI